MNATRTVLSDIKIAPTAGSNTSPNTAKIPEANGIAKMCYPAAHHKF